MTSRIIVKNLPKNISEDALRQHFSQKGQVTDVKMMATKGGNFRRFCYIGFKSESEAETAVKYFNMTFVDTSKVTVELACSVGDPNLPKPWSKYSSKANKQEIQTPFDKKKQEAEALRAELQRKRDLLFSIYEDENNLELAEYLTAMKPKSKTKTWGNSQVGDECKPALKGKVKVSTVPNKKFGGKDLMIPKVHVTFDDDVKEDDEEYQDLPLSSIDEEASIKRTDVSDLEYMKSKMKPAEDLNAVAAEEEPNSVTAQDELDDGIVSKESKELPLSVSMIAETGRLFIRNLSYSVTETDLQNLFEKFGPIAEIHLPISKDTKMPKGFAYVMFMIPENAISAYSTLDGSIFQGRILHILPSFEKKADKLDKESEKASFKSKKQLKGSDSTNWNSLFMNTNAVLKSVSAELAVKKSDIMDVEAESMATRLALAETHIINQTIKFLEEEGICLDALKSNMAKERSDLIILVKNIPFDTEIKDLHHIFGKHGSISRILIPPTKTVALVEFVATSEAKNAFKHLAYSKFKHVPLYLEWAPIGIVKDRKAAPVVPVNLPVADNDEVASFTIFVKNLNFSTTAESLKAVFEVAGKVKSCKIATKKDMKNPTKNLSMGFGFVEFLSESDAKRAMISLQGVQVEGHSLQLKYSKAGAVSGEVKKDGKIIVAEGTKLIVRNVPFEATEKEIRELFKAYGSIKRVRLPKKFDGNHRGFGFVEFMTKSEAQNAFVSLANTHLYGRHLVLEWAKEDENNLEELRKKAKRGLASGEVNKKSKIELSETNEEEEEEINMSAF